MRGTYPWYISMRYRLFIFVFFISNTCINSARLKLTKHQANAQQHPRLEIIENYSYLSMLSKNYKKYSKK